MKTTRRIFPRVLAIVLCVAGASAFAQNAAEYELNLRALWLAPEKSEDWSTVVGGEGQIRLWGPNNVGLGFAIGGQRWDAEKEYDEFVDADGWYSIGVSGDATVVPAGVSLVARNDDEAPFRLVGEVGLRYAFVDSSVEVRHTFEEGGLLFHEDLTIEIDDAVLGLIGLELGIEVGHDMWLGGGVGYQFSLSSSSETLGGENIGSTRFEGFNAFAMLAIGF